VDTTDAKLDGPPQQALGVGASDEVSEAFHCRLSPKES
jgi:hypothetical protein